MLARFASRAFRSSATSSRCLSTLSAAPSLRILRALPSLTRVSGVSSSVPSTTSVFGVSSSSQPAFAAWRSAGPVRGLASWGQNESSDENDSELDDEEERPAASGGANRGVVKWFDSERGFGFIIRDNGSDLFVHYTGISGGGFRALEEGQRVEFDITSNNRGEAATDVRVI